MNAISVSLSSCDLQLNLVATYLLLLPLLLFVVLYAKCATIQCQIVHCVNETNERTNRIQWMTEVTDHNLVKLLVRNFFFFFVMFSFSYKQMFSLSLDAWTIVSLRCLDAKHFVKGAFVHYHFRISTFFCKSRSEEKTVQLFHESDLSLNRYVRIIIFGLSTCWKSENLSKVSKYIPFGAMI